MKGLQIHSIRVETDLIVAERFVIGFQILMGLRFLGRFRFGLNIVGSVSGSSSHELLMVRILNNRTNPSVQRFGLRIDSSNKLNLNILFQKHNEL